MYWTSLNPQAVKSQRRTGDGEAAPTLRILSFVVSGGARQARVPVGGDTLHTELAPIRAVLRNIFGTLASALAPRPADGEVSIIIQTALTFIGTPCLAVLPIGVCRERDKVG